MPSTQYCSSPALQLAHLRHESIKTPTPIVSPTLNLLTCEPTCVTLPTISCPGTIGKSAGPHSSRAW